MYYEGRVDVNENNVSTAIRYRAATSATPASLAASPAAPQKELQQNDQEQALLHLLFLQVLPTSESAVCNADTINLEDNPVPMRMAVMGQHQSGKTSLLMDLACSIVKTSFGSEYNDSVNSKVLFIIPEYKRELLEFPLHCRQLHSSKDENRALGAQFDRREKEGEQFRQSVESLNAHNQAGGIGSSDPDCHHDQSAGQSWKKDDDRALEHIDVRYAKTVTDLVHFLSLVQRTYTHDLGAIIVDDLDYFIRNEFNACHGGTGVEHQQGQRQYFPANTMEIMKLIQLLALITDTANHIEESCRKSTSSTDENRQKHKCHVITSVNTDRLPLGTSSSQSKTILSLMQNYTPTIASIDKMNGQSFENDDKSFNLGHFFGDSYAGKNPNAVSMKCQSAWKIQLQTIDLCDIGPIPRASNVCKDKDIGQRSISKANFFIGRDVRHGHDSQYHDDDEESELFWAMSP